jgi:non-ribosomal peptide synthase protein (TIGR01720 family)
MNYWNGGDMLFRRAGFDEVIVKKVFDQIVEYHDALRIVYKFEGDHIIQYIRGKEPNLYGFSVIDFTNEKNYEEKIRAHNRVIQGSLDLTNGPLMKIVLYKTCEGDHLLIVIHHLILDAVSFREIIEDFRIGYRQVLQGAEIRLQPKTDSLRTWARKISEYAASKEILAELSYWKKLDETALPPLPKDAVAKSNKIIDTRTIVRGLLSKSETEKLMEIAKRADGFEIIISLLTALCMSFKDWTGQNAVMIYLASHGRENIFEDIDVSRTAGWFAIYYPVLLEAIPGEIRAQAERIQNMLKNVPNHGFGYEVLKYLTLPGSSLPTRLEMWPEISLNYSGNFSTGLNNNEEPEVFAQSGISPGLNFSPDSKRDFTLTLDSAILGGALYLRVHYNRYEYKADTIDRLISKCREYLLKIIDTF